MPLRQPRSATAVMIASTLSALPMLGVGAVSLAVADNSESPGVMVDAAADSVVVAVAEAKARVAAAVAVANDVAASRQRSNPRAIRWADAALRHAPRDDARRSRCISLGCAGEQGFRQSIEIEATMCARVRP